MTPKIKTGGNYEGEKIERMKRALKRRKEDLFYYEALLSDECCDDDLKRRGAIAERDVFNLEKKLTAIGIES